MKSSINAVHKLDGETEGQPILGTETTTEDGDFFAGQSDDDNGKNDNDDERDGTLYGTIFNFTNAPMGAGMLSFPYTFYCTGVIAGIIISAVVVILTFLTLHLLIDLNHNYRRKLQRMLDEARDNGESNPLTQEQMEVLNGTRPPGFKSYQDCIQFYLGTFFKRLCEVILLFYATGILVVYFLVIGQFIKPCVDAWVPLTSEFYHNERMIIICFSCAVIFPLLMVRKINKLWFTSFIAIGGALSLSIFTFATGVQSIVTKNYGPGQKELLWIQSGTSPGSYYPLIFLAIPLKCFGYQSHVLMFPIMYGMKPGSRLKYGFVVAISITIVSCIYMTNGLFGWIAFGTDVKDNILNNFSGKNIVANFIRLACGVNILLSFPVQNFAARLALKSIILGSRDRRLGTIAHILLSGSYFAFNLVCALFIPGLSVLFGFVGAIGAVSLMFFFPAVLVWKELTVVYGKNNLCWKIFYYCLSIFLFCVAAFFGVTGFIGSVFKFIDAVRDGKL